MATRQVVIDWDWGATGIWSVCASGDERAPTARSEWRAYNPQVDRDRHRAWRGPLSDDLIEALQAWNDRGEEVRGTQAHKYTDDERAEFWVQGRMLAARTQDELGSDYQVVYRTQRA
jgi:hypothetical protein